MILRKCVLPAALFFSLICLLPMAGKASELRRSPVVDVVAKAGPAVVNIRTEQIIKRRGSPLFGFGDSFFEEFFRGFGPTRVYKTQSLGSGVIVDSRGYILTNAHVIEQASKIYVALSGKQKEIEATLVGVHEKLDLAVIRIAEGDDYPFLKPGRANDLILGETVIAIGNPLGLGNSVTTGVVSSTHRRVPMSDGIVGHFIQTDALINPGNSGGPLLNIEGDLIGINTAIASQAQGIGFSIPIDLAKRIVSDLIDFGKVRKPYLGLLPGNVNRALVRSRGIGGVLVTDVDIGSPAGQAGFSLADVILDLDGMPVESPAELMQVLDSYTPGHRVVFKVLRGQDEITLSALLTEMPENYGLRYSRQLFGLVVQASARGVVVDKVVEDSYAAKARIRAGDRIAEVEGIAISDINTYIDVIEQNLGKLPLSFLIVRDNRGYYIDLP
ncbi:MAG: serine protease Do [Desulfuromonas sp.]|nr:MAG: serine protease Do [Desulfuromonas sp.]